MDIRRVILKSKVLSKLAIAVNKRVKDHKLYILTKRALLESNSVKNRIFYLGIPVHGNLGDLAQGVCIRRWIKQHYPMYTTVEIETNALVNTKESVLGLLQSAYRRDDFIIFQSGYTTTDLGGYADEMHRAVMKALPNARMLMLPQTILFKSEDRRQQTSNIYNSMNHLLFLARDRISYDMAKEMFPDIPVEPYPDIVTTLIGNLKFDYVRDGILFCCRDDLEKFYSDEDIDKLIRRCNEFTKVSRTDTTKKGNTREIVSNAEKLIYAEIDRYAHYKLIITDRYHGTILSLVAGTPVIIIKSNDHKVVTGAEWFKGVYDDYVYLANDLSDAYEIAKKVYQKQLTNKLQPYFENAYYDKLPNLFEEKTKL